MRIFWGLLVAGLIAAGGAMAAEKDRMFQPAPASACAVALPETGKRIVLNEPLTDPQRRALAVSIFLTLHDPTGADSRPMPTTSCPIARFAANDRVWTVHAGLGPAPVRWASTPGRDDWFFLMQGPNHADAGGWYESRKGLPAASGPPVYYLVSWVAGVHFVMAVYDGPPAPPMVAEDIAAVLEGDTRPLAMHDPAGDAVNVLRETTSGVKAQLFRPADLTDGKVASLLAADGKLVLVGNDAELVLAGSGFSCRRDYAGFARDRILVVSAQSEAPELGCHLVTDDSWTTLYVARQPDRSADRAIWADEFRGVEQQYGVKRRLANPPTGRGASLLAGRNWVDKDGFVQVVLFLRRDDYLYEIRQMHTVEELQPASDAMLALIEQIAGPGAENSGGKP